MPSAPTLDTGGSSHAANTLQNGSATGSQTVSITTTGSNELVVVLVGFYTNVNTTAISSMTATGLSFTKRSRNVSASTDSHSMYFATEVWYATAASASSITITGAFSSGGTINYMVLDAFSVVGANNSSPWDPNASLNSFTDNTTATNALAQASISTSNADDFLFAFVVTGQGASGASYTRLSANSTQIDTASNLNGAFEINSQSAYGTYTSTQSSLTAGYSDNQTEWSLDIDAITANSSGTTANAGNANVTVAANQPTVQVTGIPGAANVTVAGLAPIPVVAPTAGSANVTVAAYNPTVSIGGNTTATPGVAAVTIAANQPVVAVTAILTTAQVTVAGLAPTPQVSATPPAANVAVAALTTGSIAVTAFPGVASVAVAALGLFTKSEPVIFSAYVYTYRWTSYLYGSRWNVTTSSQRWNSKTNTETRWGAQVNPVA